MKHVCLGCQGALKIHATGDSMGIFPIHAYYCENLSCSRVGLLAVLAGVGEGSALKVDPESPSGVGRL